MRLSSFPSRSLHLGLQPAQAWMAILGLVIFSAVCILAGAGSFLRLVFPVGSFAVGLLLYWRYPVLYVGFTWWMWFLTPFVARLVDYKSGWDPQRLMQVSPYLVTLLTFITFLKHLPKSYQEGSLPFVLACTGVFYGGLVGLIKGSPFAVARSLLDWLTPLLLGFHLFVNWRDYPKLSQNLRRTFLWGVLVTGVYGVIQYMVAPEWDRFWLMESGMFTSAGSPEPFGMRIWSTMNSPGPFANMLMAGLLLLFSSQQALRIPAAAVGYLALLLTLVRSAWGGWLLGLFTLMSSVKARLQIRLIITVFVIAICVFPLTTIEPFSEKINSRFQTFSNLEEDSSFKARSGNYDKNISLALSNWLGNGIGNVWSVNDNGVLQQEVVDSGILDIFFTLGWFGAVPYISGLVLIFLSVLQYSEARFDPFMSAARAISISFCAQLIFGSSIIGPSGLFVWAFFGISMAAHKYYQHQRPGGFKQG